MPQHTTTKKTAPSHANDFRSNMNRKLLETPIPEDIEVLSLYFFWNKTAMFDFGSMGAKDLNKLFKLTEQRLEDALKEEGVPLLKIIISAKTFLNKIENAMNEYCKKTPGKYTSDALKYIVENSSIPNLSDLMTELANALLVLLKTKQISDKMMFESDGLTLVFRNRKDAMSIDKYFNPYNLRDVIRTQHNASGEGDMMGEVFERKDVTTDFDLEAQLNEFLNNIGEHPNNPRFSNASQSKWKYNKKGDSVD